ncbi:hypothetical protein [Nannocystis bainbridge]|uniref:Uncharacterized protein n=1 Tax=Nannocystis bainbridge TaxID=2995303 RepID=A0ABT5E8N6_9BACT|nr:hypothetical protein [Nannocystis bainbridge]MDC0721775.1 hypothetical protein [Nannocystis bainbridge]
MSTPVPSAHAARAGAWALLVVLATDLVFSAARHIVPLVLLDPDRPRPEFDWYRWLQWFDGADLPLRALLVGILVIGLLRLRRGSADAGARAMFLGSGAATAISLVALLMMQRRVGADALPGTLLPLTVVLDRLGVGLLLAGLWRARRALGRGVGPALSIAASIFGLRLVLLSGAIDLDWGDGHEGLVRLGVLRLALDAAECGAIMAALLGFARLAPDGPPAARLTAAAAGLDLYFRALVARVTIVAVGVVVTLAFGFTSPTARGKLLFAVLVLPLPTLIAQVAGLTRYADAPVDVGRGALRVALLAMGVGAAVEILTLVVYARLVWPDGDDAFAPRSETLVYADMLKYVGVGGQLVALVGALALLASLRRAALALGAPALQRRATALAVALAGVTAGGFVLLRLFGQTLIRAPGALFGLGLVALVIGVTVFVSWLRLVEGVAQELRARAKGA